MEKSANRGSGKVKTDGKSGKRKIGKAQNMETRRFSTRIATLNQKGGDYDYDYDYDYDKENGSEVLFLIVIVLVIVISELLC